MPWGSSHFSLSKHVSKTFIDPHIVYLPNALCAVPFWRCWKWWCSCRHCTSLIWLYFAALIFVKQTPSCYHHPDRDNQLACTWAFSQRSSIWTPKISWVLKYSMINSTHPHQILDTCHFPLQQPTLSCESSESSITFGCVKKFLSSIWGDQYSQYWSTCWVTAVLPSLYQ